jgi:murein DD-endopeptidase MepM/ murein hydrolase activator NlpD
MTLAPFVLALAAIASPPIHLSANARNFHPGELIVLTIADAGPAERLHVRAFGREWPAFAADPATASALVGIDLDVAPGRYVIDVAAGESHASFPLTVKPHAFPTRRLTVDEAFVNPPAAAADRIRAEAVELDALWKTTTPEKLWSGPFTRPVPEDANSAFGTRSVFNGQPRSPHGGADFPSRSGTPIASPAAGHVVLARELYYTGNTVVVDHGLGLYSLFAHLSQIDVQPGDRIRVGQTLGLVGATGRVTGPHLHWAVRLCGARVDPMSLVALLK